MIDADTPQQGTLELEKIEELTSRSLSHKDTSNDDDYGKLDPQTVEVGLWIVLPLTGLSALFFTIAVCHKLWTCLVRATHSNDLREPLV